MAEPAERDRVAVKKRERKRMIQLPGAGQACSGMPAKAGARRSLIAGWPRPTPTSRMPVPAADAA
jgi:hypothetical protein